MGGKQEKPPVPWVPQNATHEYVIHGHQSIGDTPPPVSFPKVSLSPS